LEALRALTCRSSRFLARVEALLARVKKEMDETRMAESTREEYDVNHTTLQELEKLP